MYFRKGTASEATVVALLAAKSRGIRMIKEQHPDITDNMQILSKLMCYASDQSHSSVERAAMLGSLNIRLIKSDKTFAMDPVKLEEAIRQDKADGLFPFYVRGSFFSILAFNFNHCVMGVIISGVWPDWGKGKSTLEQEKKHLVVGSQLSWIQGFFLIQIRIN